MCKGCNNWEVEEEEATTSDDDNNDNNDKAATIIEEEATPIANNYDGKTNMIMKFPVGCRERSKRWICEICLYIHVEVWNRCDSRR